MSPPPISLPRPAFIRKNSFSSKKGRPDYPDHNKSGSSLSVEKIPAYGSADTLATLKDEKRKNSTDTVVESPTKSAVTLTPGSGFGWGKVIKEGKLFSISTFGASKPAAPVTPISNPPTAGSRRRLDSTSRLAELRELMKAEPDGGLDYYIVPSEDAHQSEYTAPSDRRREWISGFTGSAGTCIISRSEAHAFTDSRYFIQAARELDQNWTLHKVGLPGVKPWQEWIKDRPRGSRVGIDSRLISHEAATALSAALNSRYSKLVFPRVNLVDRIWKSRPPKPQGQVFVLDQKFTGKSGTEKIEEIRAWIKSQRPPQPPVAAKAAQPTAKPAPKQPMNPVAVFLSDLSCIAWLLNIRGNDVEYNPVVISYLFITTKQAFLFVDKAKVPSEVQAHLKEQGVSIRDYGDVWSFLRRAEWGDGKVLLDSKTPYAVSLMLTSARYMMAPSFVEKQKAIKNDLELQGMRNAYARDGAAMVRWLAWLDEQIKGGAKLTEWDAGEELTRFREECANYWGLAYENISASGPNAALPHYRTTEEDAAFIDPTAPYLNDSGGQYYDGTCDTTRTVHFGFPTDEQMEAFTRVLQGHIAIDQAIFPEGTTGAQLDVLARKALWKNGLNYLHGTGHGIGSFLNVHEGPHGFSSNTPLVPGNVISNEPGFYKENAFGIRVESALAVIKVQTKGQFGGNVWLGFERLTHVPIQTKMVKMELLTKEEKAWLKNHNAQCRLRLAPLLSDDKRAQRWIRRECTKTGPSSAGGMTLDWD